MRIITYIFILLFLFSCSKQKEYAVEEVASEKEMTVDEVVHDTEEEINTVKVSYEAESKINENTDISNSETNINKDFIQQQLQETINLIGLKNSADLVEELHQDLEKTIKNKVKTANINKNLGVIEVKNIQIQQVSSKNEQTLVYFTFKVKDIKNQTKKGKAEATIFNRFVNVDSVIYTDYQIYFEKIEVE